MKQHLNPHTKWQLEINSTSEAHKINGFTNIQFE